MATSLRGPGVYVINASLVHMMSAQLFLHFNPNAHTPQSFGNSRQDAEGYFRVNHPDEYRAYIYAEDPDRFAAEYPGWEDPDTPPSTDDPDNV